MNLHTIEIGDEHADLWEGLTVENRHVDGRTDVATGTHESFGLTVVSHYGLGSIVEWWTARPIPTHFSCAPARNAALGSL